MTFHTKHFIARSTTLPHLTWLLPPKPDESLAGFTGRICSHNALRRPRVVIADVGLRSKNGFGGLARTSGSIESLATVLAVKPEWIECRRHQSVSRTFVNFHGATLRRAHMNYAVRQVVPSAIRDDPFHRELWHVQTLAACPTAAELLVDRCPAASCGKLLDWNETRGIGRCPDVNCKASLADLIADHVPVQFLPGLKRAAGLIDPNSSKQRASMIDLPRCLQIENRGDLFELAWLLGCIDHPLGVTMARDPALGGAAERCAAIAQGGDRLIEWPTSVRTILQTALQADRTGAELQRIVGNIRDIVRRAKTYGRAASLIGDELKGISSNSFSTVLARQLGLLTATEFAQIAGLKTSQMASVQRSQHLHRLLLSEGGRDIALFRRCDAEDVRQRGKSRLSAQTFAADTGLGIDAVELLIGDGRLQTVDDPIIQMVWPEQHLQPETALRLHANLQDMVVRGDRPGLSTRLSTALLACPAGEKPWLEIIDAILSGRLTLYTDVDEKIGLRSCYIDVAGKRILAALRAAGAAPMARSVWLCEADAKERLSTNGKRLRALSAAGLLSTSGNFSGRTYVRREIDSFRSRNVSVTELAAKLNVHPVTVKGVLSQAEVQMDEQGFARRADAREALGLTTL